MIILYDSLSISASWINPLNFDLLIHSIQNMPFLVNSDDRTLAKRHETHGKASVFEHNELSIRKRGYGIFFSKKMKTDAPIFFISVLWTKAAS